LNEDDAIKTIAELRESLLKIFKYHIGEANSITPFDLFLQLFSQDPNNMSIFKRNYWWNIVKAVIRNMRSNGTCFIINKRTKLFVLQTMEESKDYKNMIDRDIENMKKIKIKADNWVASEGWKKI
jgi:hypothetical protein